MTSTFSIDNIAEVFFLKLCFPLSVCSKVYKGVYCDKVELTNSLSANAA